MADLHTEIDIAAPASVVWRILTDLAAFPEWNPLIREAAGELRVGGKLRAVIGAPPSKGMVFRPRVQELEPERKLKWLGALWIPGLFDGEHRFELSPLGEKRVHLIHAERFTGILVPLVWGGMKKDLGRGFELMNEALKARAEARVAADR